jgi:hypothetical protein
MFVSLAYSLGPGESRILPAHVGWSLEPPLSGLESGLLPLRWSPKACSTVRHVSSLQCPVLPPSESLTNRGSVLVYKKCAILRRFSCRAFI